MAIISKQCRHPIWIKFTVSVQQASRPQDTPGLHTQTKLKSDEISWTREGREKQQANVQCVQKVLRDVRKKHLQMVIWKVLPRKATGNNLY